MRHRDRPVFRTAVAGVVAASALGLAGCGDTAGEETDLQQDMAVAVTGTVRDTFDVAAVEQELGTTLEEGPFQEWVGQHHVVASSVDASVASDR